MASKVSVDAVVDFAEYRFSTDLLESDVYVSDNEGKKRFVCPGEGNRIWKKRTCGRTERSPLLRLLSPGRQGVIGCVCHNCGLLVLSSSIKPFCEIYVPRGKKMFRLPPLEE